MEGVTSSIQPWCPKRTWKSKGKLGENQRRGGHEAQGGGRVRKAGLEMDADTSERLRRRTSRVRCENGQPELNLLSEQTVL